MMPAMSSNTTDDTNARSGVLARCEGIGSPVWSDAMDELGIQGVCSGLTQRSGRPHCIGFAATATGQVGELGSFTAADLGLDRMLDSATAGEVLVVDLGSAEVSAMGGLAGLAARERGIAGVVIDGGCRDVIDLQACGLWIASRHVTPRTGKRRVKYGSFGLPTRVGGVTVTQGDLVIADATGIVVVPQDRLLQVLEIAERINASDRRKESAIRSGQTFAQARRG